MEKEELEVWFAIDRRTSQCGFVAAHSLLSHRPEGVRTKLKVAYELGEMSPANWWASKLNKTFKSFTLEQVPVDLKPFKYCKGVFDSMAAYIRILIPQYSTARISLYSDADVVFKEDIGNILRECDLKEKAVALVRAGSCENQPDKEKRLLQGIQKTDNSDYFYSGLALINNSLYKQQEIITKALSICRDHPSELVYHDQTVWNCVLNAPATLHPRWCHAIYPGNPKKKEYQDGIMHFVGSPKPWDLLGEFFHPYGKIWYGAASAARLRLPKIRRYFQKESWERALRIQKQYHCWMGVR
jgi:lipopolysaccharide biosynthesis glycosyltransferase